MTDPDAYLPEDEYEDTRPLWQRYRALVIIGGILALFALLALPSILARDEIDGLKDDVNDLSEDLVEMRGEADANKAALEEANQVLIELGQRPVPVPEEGVEQNDPEIQDPERQDPEQQDPEQQDPEVNDPDPFDDPEVQDDEFQEPEIQEPEIQEDEIQDPEINDLPECPPGFTEQTIVVMIPDPSKNRALNQATIRVCVAV